jgi:hypothetical protein
LFQALKTQTGEKNQQQPTSVTTDVFRVDRKQEIKQAIYNVIKERIENEKKRPDGFVEIVIDVRLTSKLRKLEASGELDKALETISASLVAIDGLAQSKIDKIAMTIVTILDKVQDEMRTKTVLTLFAWALKKAPAACVDNMNYLSDIIYVLGDKAVDPLISLHTPRVLEFFAKSPQIFFETVTANAENANLLMDSKFMDFFEMNLEAVRTVVLIAGRDSHAGMQLLYRFGSQCEDAIIKIARVNSSLLTALAKSDEAVIKKTLENPEEFLRMANFLHKEYGIDNFQRLDYGIIEYTYVNANSKAKRGKTALIILNKDDYNHAFDAMTKQLNELMQRGYRLIICEANNEDEVRERYFNKGRRESQSGKEYKKEYDLVIIGGHGKPSYIQFGSRDAGETSYIDLGDYGQDKYFSEGSWSRMLKKKAVIILMSCSTAGQIKDSEKMKNPSNFQNIFDMMKNLAPDAEIVAPDGEASIEELLFNRRGRCTGATFGTAQAVYSGKKK